MSDSAKPLAGRGAVVTGGGRGIGAAVAAALGAAGASVVVASRSEAEIGRVAADLAASGVKAWPVACDVTDESAVRDLAQESARRLGHVDILVNAAGDAAAAPLRKVTLAEWERMIAVNATGPFLTTREFTPAMAERKWGRVVNVASIAGLEGAPYVAHYVASKHAVVGFTRAVARELAGSGVTANAVCPAYVDTALTERTIENVQARTGRTREEALAGVLATTGQERLLAPAEVADAVLALCADGAGGRSGEAVVLDGRGARAGLEIVNPPALGAPKGFSHGILGPPGARLLMVAGQPGWPGGAAGTPPGFAEQFARALDQILEVVRAAGGTAADVGRLTVYVTDLAAYRDARPALAAAWRKRFAAYYPAMALVEVKGLVDEGAVVEIEATAMIRDTR